MGSIFHPADYVLFVLILLISIGIGIFYSKYGGPNKTTGDYLLGGRTMGLVPVSISLVVSYVSSITFLGISAEIYYFGAHMAFFFLAHVIGAILSAVLFVPLLYPLKITSANEYLLARYHSRIPTLLGTFFQVFNWLCICGIICVGFAYLFETIAGCPVWATLVILLTCASLYTCIGGFRAVIWTDVFQCLIMFAGLVAVISKGTIDAGGAAKVIENYRQWGRGNLIWTPSPWHRVDMWSATLIVGVKRMVIYGIFQGSVQRYCSLPTYRKAVTSLFLAIPSDVAFQMLCVACGLVAFAYYTQLGCDPLRAHKIHNPNQIIPYFVTEILNYPGVIGLFIAAVLCGVLSTISTGLSALSAMTWHDVIKPNYRSVSNARALLINKALVMFYGVLGLCCAFLFQNISGTLVLMTVKLPSAFITGMSVLFVAGACFPRVNYRSATLGSLFAFCLVLWMTLGSIMLGKNSALLPTPTENCDVTKRTLYAVPSVNNGTINATVVFMNKILDDSDNYGGLEMLYRISSLWYCAIGLTFGCLVVVLLSFIPVFQEEEDTEVRYIFPCLIPLLTKLGRFQGGGSHPKTRTPSEEMEHLHRDKLTPEHMT